MMKIMNIIVIHGEAPQLKFYDVSSDGIIV